MPTEKSDDLKLIDEILSRSHAICWTTPEGMEQLTDSDSSRILRLARLGALVEMMPDWADPEEHSAACLYAWLNGDWSLNDADDWSGGMLPTPTAALEAALGLGEEEK